MGDGLRARAGHFGLVLLGASLASAAMAGQAFAAPTITVSPYGPSPCLADGTPCMLADAIAVANANPGTTIEMTPGFYSPTRLEIELTGDNTTIRATAPGVQIAANARAFLIRGSGTQIVGVEIRGHSDSSNQTSWTDSQKGGAIDFHPDAPDATLDLIGVRVTGGSADLGGNIYQAGGALYIADSEIDHGIAHWSGGGLYAAPGALTILDGVSVDSNQGAGAAVSAEGAAVVALNSTFVRNAAASLTSSPGALMITQGAQLTLNSVTVAANRTTGVPEISSDATSHLTFTNSILGASQSSEAVCDLNGAAVSDDHSLSADASCGLRADNGSTTNVDPRLLAYDNYGGPTLTMPPAPDSPAVDAANAATCPPIDQRYAPRPQGGGCDIGAVESPFTKAPSAGNGGGSSGSGGGAGGGGGAASAAAPAGSGGSDGTATAPPPASVPNPSTTTPTAAPSVPRPPATSRLTRDGQLTMAGRLEADPRGAITVRWTVRKGGKRYRGSTRVRSGDRVLSAAVRLPRALRGARLVGLVASYTDMTGKQRTQSI